MPAPARQRIQANAVMGYAPFESEHKLAETGGQLLIAQAVMCNESSRRRIVEDRRNTGCTFPGVNRSPASHQ